MTICERKITPVVRAVGVDGRQYEKYHRRYLAGGWAPDDRGRERAKNKADLEARTAALRKTLEATGRQLSIPAGAALVDQTLDVLDLKAHELARIVGLGKGGDRTVRRWQEGGKVPGYADLICRLLLECPEARALAMAWRGVRR